MMYNALVDVLTLRLPPARGTTIY